MIKRRTSLLATGLAASMALTASSIPAVAGSNAAQAVSAELSVREFGLPAAQVCFNDDCRTVSVPAADAGSLKLVLIYGVVSSGRLPNIDARSGTPAGCETQRSGQTARNPGVTLTASGARFVEGASLEIRQGARTIATLRDGRVAKGSTEPLSASLCLVPS